MLNFLGVIHILQPRIADKGVEVMRTLSWLSLFCGALLMASQAWAVKEPETGHVFPDSASCGGATAKVAGVGVREATIFSVDVYAVVAYASPKAAGKSLMGTSECVKLRAYFVRNVEVEKLKKAWYKGFSKNGLFKSDAKVVKFMSVVNKDMKKRSEMVMEMWGSKVKHTYMGSSVTVDGASALGRAIKKIYLGPNTPVKTLAKSVRKRGYAKP
jgi:hypothetical protein